MLQGKRYDFTNTANQFQWVFWTKYEHLRILQLMTQSIAYLSNEILLFF